MGPLLCSLALFFVVLLLSGGPLLGASLSLTPAETQEAIRAGRQSIFSAEFGKEWQIASASGEILTVLTPFHRLALAARNAAFKKEALKPREIEDLLKEHQGKLLFWTHLRGGRVDFAKNYQPVLRLGGQEIQPSFVQNERTALRLEDGRYLARCFYSFPAQQLRPNSRVTLSVRDPEGGEVARFTVDLGAMR